MSLYCITSYRIAYDLFTLSPYHELLSQVGYHVGEEPDER